MRILVVEDTLLARTMLERVLKKWGYEVDSVSNSYDAMQFLLKEPVQFIITDWVMPGGDGPSLCRDIRALNLSYYTYIILVTSLDSNESAIEGLEAGADDFVCKPIQMDELHARIRAGERVLALEKALQDRNDELQNISNNLLSAQELINRELKMAAKVQWELLPKASTRFFNITISWLFCPSTMVSGDLFNFLRLDESHVGFYSLDVAGHGVTSAMMAFTLSHLLSPDMQRGSPLKRRLVEPPYYQIVQASEVMAALNAQFQTDSNSWLYFTMVYGIIDTVTHTIQFSQAGHPNPIHIARGEGEAAKFVGEGGFPIGLTELAEYDSIEIHYHSGDRFVLYSDGITECVGLNGDMFGTDRLLESLEKNRSLSIAKITQALNEEICAWRGSASFDDDISMLILEMP